MDIRSLPYFTPLVKDYVTNFDASPIGRFFAVPPSAPHEIMRRTIDERIIRERALPKEHRETIVRSITHIHEATNSMTLAVRENLAALAETDTVAVVTGQQLGMLGGPMYAFYKAYTAILLARKLAEEHAGIRFVPIFWLESEDHDLEEVAQTTVIAGDTEVRTVRFNPLAAREGVGEEAVGDRGGERSTELVAELREAEKNWKKQVGLITFEASSLGAFFAELREALPQTAHTADVLALFERCYAPGKTLVGAFAELMAYYFADDGLLLFDTDTREVKALAAALVRRELETTPDLSGRIVLQSGLLEEHYHAQVKPRSPNLFYITDEPAATGGGDRLPIVEAERTSAKDERRFFLKGTRRSFSLAEILRECDEHPERFSPNVVLRPLYQDWLLPTISYVAGPGETAYFAQFRPGFEWAGLPAPLIQPRLTATILDERSERALAKHNITAEELLIGGVGKSRELLDAAIASDTAAQFATAIARIDETLEALRPTVTTAEATLDGALTSIKGKVLTTVRDFEAKTLAAERKRHATTKTQLDKLYAALLPDGGLQERQLGMIHFLNKYGPSFVPFLKRALAALPLHRTDEHHIVTLR